MQSQDFHAEVLEVIAETISGLQATCRITLYDIYGSTDGFHESTFQEEAEENARYVPRPRSK